MSKDENARLSPPSQYDEKLIEGEHFNYRDEYATGPYIEKRINAGFSDRVLSWKEVLTILDSTITPLIGGELEKEIRDYFGAVKTNSDAAAMANWGYSLVTALHNELGFTRRIADKLALDYDDLLGKFDELIKARQAMRDDAKESPHAPKE